MKLIIASDIFGRTPALEQLADDLLRDKIKPVIIDPYNKKRMAFKSESEAYAFFMKNVGLKGYQHHLYTHIKYEKEALFLVGFSIGASAIWMGLAKNNLQGRAICFYGSQIRYYPDIEPTINTRLIFPEHEPGFNVTALIESVSIKQNVICSCMPYSHGFMNQLSDNFNPAAYQDALCFLKRQLSKY